MPLPDQRDTSTGCIPVLACSLAGASPTTQAEVTFVGPRQASPRLQGSSVLANAISLRWDSGEQFADFTRTIMQSIVIRYATTHFQGTPCEGATVRRNERLPVLVLSLFIINGSLGLLYLLVRIVNVPSTVLQQWTDLGYEGSIASWYSSVQLLLPAILLAPIIVSAFERRDGHPWALLVLAAMFVVLSADESIEFHEWISYKSDALLPGGARIGTAFQATGVWTFLLGIPFIIGLGLLIRQLHVEWIKVPGVRTKFIAGAAIWLGGALGVETLGNLILPSEVTLHIGEVFLEETAEMFGVSVMVWAIYRLLMGLGFQWRLARGSST